MSIKKYAWILRSETCDSKIRSIARKKFRIPSKKNVAKINLSTMIHQIFEYLPLKRREAPSICIYGIRRQRVKSLKMVVETSDKYNLFYMYILNPFLECPDSIMMLFDNLYLGHYCPIKIWDRYLG